jgi:hypothetical protein
MGGTRIGELLKQNGKYEKPRGSHGEGEFHVFDFVPIRWGVFMNFQVSCLYIAEPYAADSCAVERSFRHGQGVPRSEKDLDGQ